MIAEKRYFHNPTFNPWCRRKTTNRSDDKRCRWPNWHKNANEAESETNEAEDGEENGSYFQIVYLVLLGIISIIIQIIATAKPSFSKLKMNLKIFFQHLFASFFINRMN